VVPTRPQQSVMHGSEKQLLRYNKLEFKASNRYCVGNNICCALLRHCAMHRAVQATPEDFLLQVYTGAVVETGM
jgi:hypothetical protein